MAKAKEDKKIEEPTEFAVVFMTHGKGLAHDRASQMLRDVVAAVKRTGKAGSVTVTLKVNPVDNNDLVVGVEDSISCKIPEEKRGSMWYVDDVNTLHRNDPNQYAMWNAETGDTQPIKSEQQEQIDNPNRNHEPKFSGDND